MPRAALPGFALACLAVIAAGGSGQEPADPQKIAAVENLKKAELTGYSVAQSESLLFASPLPAERGKAVAELLEKTVKTARKGLGYGDKEEAWKGRLTLYHVPNMRAYGTFARLVAGDRAEGGLLVAVKGDEPMALSGVESGAKATDADLAADLGPAVGAAFLQSKVGPTNPVPTWVRNGFGRAAALRAEGPAGKRLVTYKTAAKTAVLGKGRGPATLGEVWGGSRPDAELLATAFMDYLAFGSDKAGQEKFTRFLTGLRPDENGDSPDAAKAVETAGWKAPELEQAWRNWASKGLPVK